MNGVDKHDQHRMKYTLGWFSVKYWKYLFWFLVNSCVVNAYILYEIRSTRQIWDKIPKAIKKELQTSWLLNWIGPWPHSWLFIQKWRSDTLQYLAPRPAIIESSHEIVRMDLTRKTSRRCKWHLMQKSPRREMVYGCKLCNVYLCKDGCHLAYHNQQ